jgi:glutamate synthase domain-containing protein 2
MVETGVLPDYISIDGGEGGTGAAPLEFSNFVGSPGVESLIFVHNVLTGFGLRNQLRVFTSGKVTTAFDIIKRIAIGADVVYSARGMLLSMGCIQALRCHSNHCPTGITTQNPSLVAGLHVPTKRERVARFHRETIKTLSEVIGAMGIEHTSELKPWHIMRRTTPESIKHYGEIYNYLESGSLLTNDIPPEYRRAMAAASASSFRHVQAS